MHNSHMIWPCTDLLFLYCENFSLGTSGKIDAVLEIKAERSVHKMPHRQHEQRIFRWKWHCRWGIKCCSGNASSWSCASHVVEGNEIHALIKVSRTRMALSRHEHKTSRVTVSWPPRVPWITWNSIQKWARMNIYSLNWETLVNCVKFQFEFKSLFRLEKCVTLNS